MSIERRINPRVKCLEIVELVVDGNEKLVATCIDVSKAGLLCKSAARIELYAQVHLELSLPVHGIHVPIQCDGTVSRSVEDRGMYNSAILFHVLPAESLAALEKFIQSELNSASNR